MFTVFGMILINSFVALYTKGINDANYVHPIFGYIILLAEMTHCLKDPYVNMAYCAGKFKDIRKHAVVEAIINIVLSVLSARIAGRGFCCAGAGTDGDSVAAPRCQTWTTEQIAKAAAAAATARTTTAT